MKKEAVLFVVLWVAAATLQAGVTIDYADGVVVFFNASTTEIDGQIWVVEAKAEVYWFDEDGRYCMMHRFVFSPLEVEKMPHACGSGAVVVVSDQDVRIWKRRSE